MKRWLLVAALGWLACPRATHGEGSGSDDEGDYDYRWVKLRFGRFSVVVNWWPEKVVDR